MTELEKLHCVHLELTDEVHRICEKNQLKYSLVAGSLLGAVRHQGFIPWDDDLDLGMLREDYDKFVDLLVTDLKSEFYFMSLENHKQYGTPFIKIMKKNTIIKEGNLPEKMENYGIFIDIFQFDTVPVSHVKKKIHSFSTEILKKMILAKSDYILDLNTVSSLIFKILKHISKIFSRDFLVQYLKKNMIRYNNEASDFITAIGGSYGYTKETIKKEWFDSLVLYKFEDREYWGFKAYDSYLSALYGDYMKLPAHSNRENRHNYGYICFDSSN